LQIKVCFSRIKKFVDQELFQVQKILATGHTPQRHEAGSTIASLLPMRVGHALYVVGRGRKQLNSDAG
jgi:hypothetical protein